MIDSLKLNDDFVRPEHGTSIKIELTLDEPLNKTKSKSFVFSLLDELQINDETDLYSISYAIHKLDKQVHKMIIHFKSIESGDRFFAKIETGKDEYKLSNLIKNFIDKTLQDDEELVSMNDDLISTMRHSNVSNDSIYVINDMGCSYIENSSLIIETSYYNVDNPMSKLNEEYKSESLKQFSTELETLKISLETIISSEQTVALIRKENYFLELNSNKVINSDDLDTLVIYLENEAANNINTTDSSDIIDYKIADESNGYQLVIKFENVNSAEYLLSKKHIHFKDYRFQIAQLYTKPQHIKPNDDKRTIILSKIATNVDLNMVKIFAENISLNKVKFILKSKIFADTFVVKFSEDINIDLIKQRLARRPNLKSQKVELIIPKKTNIILLTGKYSDIDDIVLPDNCSIKSIHKRQSFYFIEFESDKSQIDFEQKLNCVDKLTYEELFSFEFLNKKEVNAKLPILSQKNDSSKSNGIKFKAFLYLGFFLFGFFLPALMWPNKLILSRRVNDFTSNTQEDEIIHINTVNEISKKDNIEHQQQQQPVYVEIDMNEKPDFKYLIYWPDKQIELNDDLKELNAILSIDERIKKIMIWPSDKSAAIVKSGEWNLKLNNYLHELMDSYDTVLIQIKNPTSTVDRITYNRLRVSFKKLDDLLWNSSFEVAGYKEDVQILLNKIESENKKNF